MAEHFVEVCSCGTVISQCRCPSPHKVERVVPGGCRACRGEPAGGGVFQIPVFRAEREAGLEQAVRGSASVALAAVVRAAEDGRLSGAAVARLRGLAHQFAKSAQGDFDLHHLTTVLVTTGWNRNDDVFDPFETWVARRSPEDKPLNYEHDDARIVGHITSNWVVGEDGKTVADDSAVDDLPAKFHVVTGAVLYKCWQTPELQERMDTLLAEIAKGTWFVSMECLFKGFDYALLDRSGGMRVVARSEKTAFLSKHLRAYGGSGQYGDSRIGRLMRNIVFSGKGLVKNPANPESVILQSETETFSAACAEHVTDISPQTADRVYLPVSSQRTDTTQESKQVMTVTVEQLQADNTALRAEVEKLKATHQDAVVADLTAKLAASAAAKAGADDLLKKAGEALAGLQAQAAEAAAAAEAARAELAESKASLAESQDELKKLYAEKTQADRVAAVKEKLKFADDAAADFVATNAGLTDEQFGKQVEVLAKAMTAWVTNNPAPGNTTHSGPAAKAPPKATDKPTAPQSTGKPAPNKASVEADAAGEAAAAGADLETAVANADATLSTSVGESGVSDVQKLIASALGWTDEQAKS